MSDQDWIHADPFETGGLDSKTMVSLWRESDPEDKVELTEADYEATKARVGTADHGKLWAALKARRPGTATPTAETSAQNRQDPGGEAAR